MRHYYRTNEKATTVVATSPSGFRNLPPVNSWVDLLLENLFPESDHYDDVLTPFDYEGFLRKEGLV